MINKEAYLINNTLLSAKRTIITSGRLHNHLRLLFRLFDVYVPPDVRRRYHRKLPR